MQTTPSPERIVAAAVQYRGVTLSLPPPARHHTILQTMDILVGISQDELHSSYQGFLTNEGRYVNRVEAWYIAYKADQLIHLKGDEKSFRKPELYSEDLW